MVNSVWRTQNDPPAKLEGSTWTQELLVLSAGLIPGYPATLGGPMAHEGVSVNGLFQTRNPSLHPGRAAQLIPSTISQGKEEQGQVGAAQCWYHSRAGLGSGWVKPKPVSALGQ